MKHHVLGSLTAALVMSTFGAPLASYAQQVDETDPLPSAETADAPEMALDESPDPAANAAVHPENSASGSLSNSLVSNSPSPVSNSPVSGSTELTANTAETSSIGPSPALDSAPSPTVETLNLANLASNDAITIVQAHAFDNRQAATLYVRNLPVLTFLGSELATLANNKSLEAAPSRGDDPVLQANRIGTQLEEFYRNQGNAEQISVRWDPSQEQYLVTLNGTPLIAVDSDTILPDTTADPAQDALQVANRLRRLIGDAPPLEDIEGRPQLPEASTLAVTSVLSGMASWYGPGFHGRRSASGEVFDQNAMTAAHRTLPFGTEVRVTNLSNNRQVVVRINDRGPFGHGRVLDLSAAAAQSIGLAQRGVGMVRIEVLGRP